VKALRAGRVMFHVHMIALLLRLFAMLSERGYSVELMVIAQAVH